MTDLKKDRTPAELRAQAERMEVAREVGPPDQSEKLAEMEARKDAAYYERNQVVAALTKGE